MSISTPPKKKSSCGCFGCGCFFVIIVLLVAGMVGGLGYFGYKGALEYTTTVPKNLPAFTPTDAAYSSTQQKITQFQQAADDQHPAAIRLNSDEINTLISHAPEMAKKGIQTYVTMTGSEGRIQVTAPTDAMAPGILPGRYLNFDVTFGLTFDQPNKMVILTPKALKIGAKTILDENSEASQAAFNSSFNKAFMNSFAPAFNQSFNQGLRKNPDVAKFLDHAKSIEIKDSELVIETQ